MAICTWCADEMVAGVWETHHCKIEEDRNICEDCGSKLTITLEPYGESKMAVYDCPNCGQSYDTNLEPTDYCEPCGQVAWLCICEGERK